MNIKDLYEQKRLVAINLKDCMGDLIKRKSLRIGMMDIYLVVQKSIILGQ